MQTARLKRTISRRVRAVLRNSSRCWTCSFCFCRNRFVYHCTDLQQLVGPCQSGGVRNKL